MEFKQKRQEKKKKKKKSRLKFVQKLVFVKISLKLVKRKKTDWFGFFI